MLYIFVLHGKKINMSNTPTKMRDDRSELQNSFREFAPELSWEKISKIYNQNKKDREQTYVELENKFKCSICGTSNNLVRFDRCDHYHCEDCVNQLLYTYRQNKCPICRREIRAYINVVNRDAHFYEHVVDRLDRTMTNNNFSMMMIRKDFQNESLRRSLSY